MDIGEKRKKVFYAHIYIYHNNLYKIAFVKNTGHHAKINIS